MQAGRAILTLALLSPVIVSAQPTENLIAELKDSAPRVRRLAAEALGKQKAEAAIAPLVALLKDSDPAVREVAADALVRFGAKAAATLARALGDESAACRSAAADTLLRLGPGAKTAVKELTAALRDKEVGVRMRASAALANVGPDARDALPALFEASGDTANSGALFGTLPKSVAEAAIDAALRIDPGCGEALARAALPRLKAVLAGKDPAALRAAAAALDRLGPHGRAALKDLEVARDTAARLDERGKFTDRAIRRAVATLGGDPTKPHSDAARDRTLKTLERCQAIWNMRLGPGVPEPEAAVTVLKELLKDPDADIRAVAAEELKSIGPAAKAVPELLALLGDRDLEEASSQRFGIAPGNLIPQALARMGGPAAPELAAILKDDSKPWETRRRAAESLWLMGGAARPALPVLEAALSDPSAVIAVQAAGAYARAGGELSKSLPVLRDGLRHKLELPALVAAKAAGRLGIRAKELAPDLIPLVDHREKLIWTTAADALSRMGSAAKPAVPAMAKRLELAGRFERDALAEALGRLGADARDAVPALVSRLGDKDPERTFTFPVLDALGEIGPAAQTAVPRLLELLNGKDRALAFHAVATLGKIGPGAKDAVPSLAKYLDESDPGYHFRGTAARALGGIGRDAAVAVPALKKLLSDEDRSVRVWAAYALARIEGESEPHVVSITELCKDDRAYPSTRPFTSVRQNATEALDLLGLDAKPARELLLEILLDPKAGVQTRTCAARAVGRLGDESGMVVAKLVELIDQPQKGSERSDNCRSAAVALMGLGPKARSAVPQLRRLVADEDDGVADAAARALEKISPKSE